MKCLLSDNFQDATLSHYAGYTEAEILPVFKLMVDYCRSPIKHESFYKKYSSKKYLKGELHFSIQFSTHFYDRS